MTEPSWLHDMRRSYDVVAADYAELLRDELGAKPLDRAMLAAFVELVQAGGGGPVADLGCGPGRITGPLAALELDVHGVSTCLPRWSRWPGRRIRSWASSKAR